MKLPKGDLTIVFNPDIGSHLDQFSKALAEGFTPAQATIMNQYSEEDFQKTLKGRYDLVEY